jgi:hypothetical protein
MGDMMFSVPIAALWFCGGGIFWVVFLLLIGGLINAAKHRKARREGR